VIISAVLDEKDMGALREALATWKSAEAVLKTQESDLEAIQKIYLEGMPSILVLDLDLPAVIGLETVAALRRQEEMRTLPILVVSGADHRLAAHQAGATLHIPKPVTPDNFIDALKWCLQTASEGSAAAAAPVSEGAHKPKPGEESRKAIRKPLETACIVSTAGQKLKGMLKDISLTGARISLSANLEDDDLITLIIGVPGTIPLKVVQFKARVVRQAGEGYGLAFRQMDPDTRAFVMGYTQREGAGAGMY
jgi:DNA-binding response OmpR family regulator